MIIIQDVDPELAAKREAKKKAELAKKTTTKPGEGRLSVKICPYFRNVSSPAGSDLVASDDEDECLTPKVCACVWKDCAGCVRFGWIY